MINNFPTKPPEFLPGKLMIQSLFEMPLLNPHEDHIIGECIM